MRRDLGLAALLLAIVLLPLAVPRTDPAPDLASDDLTVLDWNGEVDVQQTAKSAWVPAKTGCVLPPGSKVCAGVDSEVLIACGTNGLVHVGEATMFEVVSLNHSGPMLVLRGRVDPGDVRVLVRPGPSLAMEALISRPRLTCSVRSSGECVYANGDESVEEEDDGDAATVRWVRVDRALSIRPLAPRPAPPTPPAVEPIVPRGRADDSPRLQELAREFDRILARSGLLARRGAACAEARRLMTRVALENIRAALR